MTDSLQPCDQSNAITPASVLYGESGSASTWLDADWKFEDIRYEWDWLFDHRPMEEQLKEIWFRMRATTQAERDDPDALYDLFGDCWEDLDISYAYEQVKPGTEGAHKYWTVD
jgi:hypothetical protein